MCEGILRTSREWIRQGYLQQPLGTHRCPPFSASDFPAQSTGSWWHLLPDTVASLRVCTLGGSALTPGPLGQPVLRLGTAEVSKLAQKMEGGGMSRK